VVIYLKTGSRYERAEDNGLSHFLEHMLFRGTEQHPTAHRLATAFEELGGTLDASTAADYGTLGIDVPVENLAAVFPLLAQVYSAPLLSEVAIERGIIREEILEDLGENGEMVDPPSLVRALAFGRSGLGQPITGPLSNVERFTQAELRAHHQRTYVGAKAVISVAGRVSPDVVTRQLEEAFGILPPGTEIQGEAPPAQSTARFLHVKHPGSSQTSVCLSYRCPGQNDRREPAVEMLLRVIDDGMATRLYHELCDQRGLCYSVSGSYEAYDDAGLVELEADAAHQRAPEVLAQMLNITSTLTQDLITDAEFERTRKRARWQHEAYSDEAGPTADFFAMGEFSNTARTPADRLDELLAVSKEDIRAAAAHIFADPNRNVVTVGGSDKRALEKLARETQA
jgi:predicted Zn-dependent peptidase